MSRTRLPRRGRVRAAGRRAVRAVVLLPLFALLGGCTGRATLTRTFESDEALGRAVLEAMARRDAEALLGWAVTKEEFEDLVWPTLRVSRPEVGMPVEFVWRDQLTKNRAYLESTLRRYGGEHFELVRVEFDGATTDQGTHAISRTTRLIVRDAEGRERGVRLFGSIIRQQGRSKVFSYIVD